ncbi:MAG: NUDIX hydrolase [Solobacterium sp.]|nr:NUDIX domain-containing protein [Erysipelotrichaceae bacterium]MBQ1447128.1 NUDIX hydrolase [Solobacterium sp.]
MNIYDEIRDYVPYNEQEETDKEGMLAFLDQYDNAFLRENELGHFTASVWIVNPERTKTVLAYHILYDSWAWIGGHADGETDLRAVAMRELEEETGIRHAYRVMDGIYSLETVHVPGHVKHGKYVSSHLHFNVTWLVEADESEALQVREDENKAVRWFALEDVEKASSEPWMVEHVYRKLIDQCRKFDEKEH